MKYCPKCASEYEGGVERCPTDGTHLLETKRRDEELAGQSTAPLEPATDAVKFPNQSLQNTTQMAGAIEDLIFKLCTSCDSVYGGGVDHCPRDGARLVEQSILAQETIVAGLKSATLVLKKYCPDCKRHYALHVDVCKDCGSRLEIPTVGGSVVEHVELGEPEAVIDGKYRLLQQIGKGGFGAVYIAKHESLGKRYAIKALRPQLAERTAFRNRFHEEALKLSRLEDENIVKVFDFGEWEDHQYMVTEYVEGEDLDSLIYGEKVDPLRAAKVMKQVASALAEAHAKKIVHLDLKPANILVTQKRGRDIVKVIDFGIAEIYSETRARQQEMVAGTYTYMSPEQWRRQPLDPRTDLYSFGVIFYEFLAGRPPFRQHKISELEKAHCELPPPPIRSLRSDTPAPLEKLVHRCLEKEPERRLRSAEEIEATLDAYVRRTENVLGRWLARVAAAVVIGLLLAGGIWWAWNTWVADREPPRVTFDVKAAEGRQLWPAELTGFQKAYTTRGDSAVICLKATDDREVKELIVRSESLGGKKTFQESEKEIVLKLNVGWNRLSVLAVDAWGNESETVLLGFERLQSQSRKFSAPFLGENAILYTSRKTVDLEILTLTELKARVICRYEDSANADFEFESAKPQTLPIPLKEGANTITISTVDLRNGETFGDDVAGVVKYLDPDANPLEVKATVREDVPDALRLEGKNRWVSAKDEIEVTIDVEVPLARGRLDLPTDLFYRQDKQPSTKEDLTEARKTLRVTLSEPGKHTITIEKIKDLHEILSDEVTLKVEWERDQEAPALELATADEIPYYDKELLPTVRFRLSDRNPLPDDAGLTLEQIEKGNVRTVSPASFQLATDGLWELRFTSPEVFREDGRYQFRIRARDKLGNRTDNADGNFTVIADHTAPEIEIVSPQAENAFKTNDTIPLAARVTDAFPDDLRVEVILTFDSSGNTWKRRFPLSFNPVQGVWENRNVRVDSSGVKKPNRFDSLRPNFLAVFRATDRGGKSDEKERLLFFAWENGDELHWGEHGCTLVYHEACLPRDVPAFFMGRTEVSNGQYKAFLEAQGDKLPHPDSPEWKNGTCPPERLDFPVRGVTWKEAMAYAEWAGLELAGHREWLVAAFWDYDKGAPRRFPWGSEDPKGNRWPVRGGGEKEPKSPVSVHDEQGAYSGGQTELGLVHMFGNVWELVLDPENARVCKVGGAFDTSRRDFLNDRYVRGDEEARSIPDSERRSNLGFRCMRRTEGAGK